jgi:DNA-directed RNA polymerase subunit RPC12/RpoP
MGSAKFETLVDFNRHDCDVAIRCTGCGHTRTVKVPDLGAALGWGTRLPVARKRLRCQECGRRGAKLIPVPRLD